jgi:parvulin-like peptidyl-prolyl isomerase
VIFAAGSAAAQPVVQVGPNTISRAVLERTVQTKIPRTSFHKGVSQARLERETEQVLEQLIEEELLFLEAGRRKIVVSKAELDALLKPSIQSAGNPQKLEDELRKAGYSVQDLRDFLEKNELVARVTKAAIDDKAKVTRADAEKFYLANKDKYVQPGAVNLKHALAKADPSEGKKGREGALGRAEKIAAALNAGESFESLGKKYSGDDFKTLGWVHLGSLMPQIDEVAAKLEKGKVSEPIGTMYGYHVIHVIDRRPSSELAFDIVADAVIAQRTEARKGELRQQLLKECRQRWAVKKLLVAPKK